MEQEQKGNSSTLLGIVVVIVIIAGAWWALAGRAPSEPSSSPDTTTGAVGQENQGGAQGAVLEGASEGVIPMTAEVMYTSSGFSPKEVTIAQGGTVTWKSQDGSMWVASDEHPTHTEYDGTARSQHCPNSGTAFDQCGVGDTYSFTFDKVGDWNYHNHTAAQHEGVVHVVAQ